MRHTRMNQERLSKYNLGKQIAQGLGGDRNSAPQNSGCAVASVHLSQPIFDHRGYMKKNCSYAECATIRGEQNLLTAIDRGAVEFGFSFMKITEAEEVHKSWQSLHGQKYRACGWDWVRPSTRDEARQIITNNKHLLKSV